MMNGIQLYFSFKFVNQGQVFKEIRELNGNKASQKMKKNIDIMSYILYHNLNNSLFDPLFPSKIKEVYITNYITSKKSYRSASILLNVSKVYERLM